MKRILVLAFAAALLVASPAHAAPIVFKAILDGPSESPPTASTGTGFAKVTFDPVAHTLDVHTTFADLLGLTTASHIHCCTAAPGSGTAGVATQVPRFIGFPTGVSAGSYAHLFDLSDAASFNPAFVTAHGGTAAGAEAALFAGMMARSAYFNIHTDRYPGGEIRGFLRPVPEPATLLLFAVGAAGVARKHRRR